MTQESKDRIEKIVLGVVPPVIVFVLTAVIKGDELTGLTKVAAVLRILKTAVPLWMFLIVLVVAVLGSARWVKQAIVKKEEALHVTWQPEQCMWTLGSWGTKPTMQVITTAYVTNPDKKNRLIITSVYLKGTKPIIGQFEPIEIEAQTCSQKRIDAYVAPVVCKVGEQYVGTIIFVDQFARKHKFPVELRSGNVNPAPPPQEQEQTKSTGK